MVGQIPVELRVWMLLRERVPGLPWDARRIALAVADYQDTINTEEVAAQCADWMMSGQRKRLRDPNTTLRSFFQRAADQKRQQDPASLPELQRYDRPMNRGRSEP